MSDLRSQLLAEFGPSQTADAAPPEPVADGSDPLGGMAHMGTPWLDALLPAARKAGGLKVPSAPSLNAAKQLHDRLIKQLKAQGRGRERRELDDHRSRYLKRREKTAWTRLKTQLTGLGVSAKVYRSLKQSAVDPERVLQRVARAGESAIRGMSQTEQRALLMEG